MFKERFSIGEMFLVYITCSKSLILAQDERWRRA